MKRYKAIIDKLSQMTKKDMIEYILSNLSSSFQGRHKMECIVSYFKLNQDKAFCDRLADAVIKDFNASQKYYWNVDVLATRFNRFRDMFISHHSDFADLFLSLKNQMGIRATKIVIESFVKHKIISDEQRLVKFFQLFYRSIKPNHFQPLMRLIPGGVNNPDVKLVLRKTRIFNYLNYEESKVKSDFNERVKLIKDIAKTRSILKNLPFSFTVGFDEIKEMPPVMRFDFLKNAFYYEHQVFCRKYYTFGYHKKPTANELQVKVNGRKMRVGLDKMTIEPLDPEKVKELLFSISIQKTSKVENWFNNYQKYYNIRCGKESVETVKF